MKFYTRHAMKKFKSLFIIQHIFSYSAIYYANNFHEGLAPQYRVVNASLKK